MMVVIVITGMLSAVGLVNYSVIKEKAANREAKTSLPLIQVAERSYRMEHASFYPSSGSISNTLPADRILINSNLRLSLPISSLWTITLYYNAGSGYATATRSGRTWRIDFPAGSAETPVCSPCGTPSCPC